MLLDAWRLAVGTLTAVPVTQPSVVDRRRAGVAMAAAPLAVAPLALGAAVVAFVGHALALPVTVVAVLVVATVVLGNRAFHLDGLSDTADALAASYDRERSLEVMYSGASGPAGVVACVLVLGLQVAGLAGVLAGSANARAAVLAGLAVCASRAILALCCARGIPPARSAGLGLVCAETLPRVATLTIWLTVAVVLSAAGAWAGLAWWRGLLAATMAVLVVAALLTRAWRRLGGVTGDVFGAAVELALAAILVVLS